LMTALIKNDADVYLVFTIAILFTTTGTSLSLILPQIPWFCCPHQDNVNYRLVEERPFSIMEDELDSSISQSQNQYNWK